MLWRSRFHTTSVMSVLTSKEPHICKRAPYPQDSSAPRPLLHSSRTHWTWIYHHRHGDPEHWHDSSWPAAHSPSKKQMTTLCNTPSTPLLGAESGKRLQRGCGNGTRWQIYYGIVWIVLVMAHMLFLQKIFQNLKPRCSGSMGKFSNLATSCHVQHMLIDEDGTMNWAGHVELDWRVHSEYLMSTSSACAKCIVLSLNTCLGCGRIWCSGWVADGSLVTRLGYLNLIYEQIDDADTSNLGSSHLCP